MKTNRGFARIKLFVVIAIIAILPGLLRTSEDRAFAQAPVLHLEAEPDRLQLTLRGQPAQDYRVESAERLDGAWQTSLQLTLTGEQFQWFDSQAAGITTRFYRAVQLAAPPEPELAEDFRLLDHTGKARHLHYWEGDTNVAAFVLLFAAKGPAGAADEINELKALQQRFAGRKVWFWIVDATGEASRAKLTAEAQTLGLRADLPVLHDRARLVAHTYGVRHETEVIAVDSSQWTVFYRGPISESVTAGATAVEQAYLADALESFLDGVGPTVQRVRPLGEPVEQPWRARIDYATEIAPLLQAKCIRCHSPGNIGPFAMTDFKVVKVQALNIRYQILAQHMPPWHADPEYGVWDGDFSLLPEQASRLVRWIDQGTPRGDGPDPLAESPPPPKDYPLAWPTELGEPDAILTFAEQSIKATGIEAYRDLRLQTSFPSNIWLRAAVVLPGNPAVVHHMIAFQALTPDNENDQFAEYHPGQGARAYPAGAGRLLPKGATILLNSHYVTSGTPQKDQPRIGLYFRKERPPLVTEVNSIGWFTDDTGTYPPIKPFVMEDVRTADSQPITTDVWLFQVHPHMHLRGTRINFEALLPRNGGTNLLLSVPMFESHWEAAYRFAQPPRFPKGTRFRITGAFDNSEYNPLNPAPEQTVKWGAQLSDEMFASYFHLAHALTIVTHPRSQAVQAGGTVSFTVITGYANGTPGYQWQFDGADITGATTRQLSLTNVQPAEAGEYVVRITDNYETLVSSNAVLTVNTP